MGSIAAKHNVHKAGSDARLGQGSGGQRGYRPKDKADS